MEGIQVSVEVAGSRNQISVIKVGGYIDTTTSSEVERALNALLKQGRYKVIVDLGNVDYISSAGWGIFISEIKTIRENFGDLKLIKMIPDVYEIFELLEFHHILDVYDSSEEAAAKFEESEATAPKEKQPLYKEKVESKYSMETPAQVSSEINESSSEDFDTESVPEPDFRPKSPAELTLEEKVRYVVAHNPRLGAFRLSKMLNSLEYGYTRIGWLNTKKLLKKLNLNSSKNRFEFAQKSKDNYLF
ncbi:MAG: STAS domain-containing protein [Calditrichia bacterium]|nr:STAS domain-containing protein [Calditrichia bacterium]